MEYYTRIFSVIYLTLVIILKLCSCKQIVYHFHEEQPGGRFIGNVAYDSNLNLEMNESDFQTLRYNFLSTDVPYISLFNLNTTNGNLYTVEILDREKICPFMRECVLDLEIGVQSTILSFFRKIITRIFIDDINDNSPIFERSSMSLSISESVLIGTSFTIDGARDKDTSQNYSLQTYDLAEKGMPFTVKFVKKLDGTSIVRLVVSDTLDRELRDKYQLTVVAKDGGHPEMTSQMLVNVTILDVNDNAPMLSSSDYEVSVNEDTAVGSVIFTLSATDIDLGDNAKINYRLSPHQSTVNKNLFSMDSVSGELRVMSPLSYVHGRVHRVIVEASDSAEKPLTTQAYVTVTVIDSRNNPPKITVNLLTDSNSAKVSEFANADSVVALVVVQDEDSGMNGIVRCSIISQYFKMNRLDVNEYTVQVAQPLDRETIERHNLRVECSDSGSPPLSSYADFVVEVNDVNDNAPVFSLQTYKTRLFENNNIGDIILQVTATDKDDGLNAEITYVLLQENDTLVKIDERSGIIRANNVFDREKLPNLSFKVVAIDNGDPRQFGTATVSIAIEDKNDNMPRFIEPLFIFKITENRKPGTLIGKLFADDKDDGDNGKVEFSTALGRTSSVPFIVYPDGTIRTADRIDREKHANFTFNVVASDLGLPSLSSTATVKIFVADENDNSPILVFPSKTNNTLRISNQTPAGTFIARIQAFDIDESLNGEVSYMIGGYNMSDLVELYAHTGDLILLKDAAKITETVIRLSIVVSDKGTPRRTSVQGLTVVIADAEPKTNLLIVITIVSVTVIVSLGIIVTICVIKRLDNGKRKHCSTDVFNKPNFDGKPENGLKLSGKTDSSFSDIGTSERKRKEVTFAFEPTDQKDDRYSDINTHSSYDPHITVSIRML